MDSILFVIVETIIAIIVISIVFYYGYFLRQPKRSVPYHNRVFVSPASGKVISIISTEQEHIDIYKDNEKALELFTDWLCGPFTIVSIMMTPMDVHYQRAPYDSIILDQAHYPGKFYNAVRKSKTLKSTFRNENNQMLFETDTGIRYKVIQIAGLLARRIVSYIKPWQEVQQGDVIGLIKFGSQVTIVFDNQVDVIARIGQKVVDGETVLALTRQE